MAGILLKVDDHGPQVGELHQRLVEAGEQIDKGELSTALFGPSTKVAVLDFQTNHLDAKGRPLKVDGEVGDLTWAALANPRQPTEIFIAKGWRGEPSMAPNIDAMLAVTVAIAEIGTKENPPGSNRGPRVDVYEGKDWLGSPWCALFISFCWDKTPLGSPFGVKASALKLKEWGEKKKAILAADVKLLPGDVGIILRAEGRGHVEIVTGCEFDDKLSLVGGNVGNAVRGTVRRRDAFSHFMRPRG